MVPKEQVRNTIKCIYVTWNHYYDLNMKIELINMLHSFLELLALHDIIIVALEWSAYDFVPQFHINHVNEAHLLVHP